jgi:hypothetical protein
MITIGGRKLFEKIDRPKGMKNYLKKFRISRNTGWLDRKLKGFNGFSDGKK